MRRGFVVALITALPPSLLLFFATIAQSQTSPSIARVEIKSILSQIGGGLGKPRNKTGPAGLTDVSTTSLILERKDGSYFLQGTDKSQDKVVDAPLIAALAKAISSPANPAPSAEDLGITPEWLKANAPLIAQKFSNTQTSITTIGGHPIHPDLFEAAFTDPAMIDKAIRALFSRQPSCFDCIHYFNSVSVIVTFDDGTMVKVHSHSRLPYMLPWNFVPLAGPNTGTVAYNADISRAVLALLPEKSENRSLLAGEKIGVSLGSIVLREEEVQTRQRESLEH